MALNIGTHPRSRKKIRLHRRRHVSVESYTEHTCENVPVSRLPSCFCVMSRRGLLPSTPRARVVDPVLLQPPFAQKCSSIVGPPLPTQPVPRIPDLPGSSICLRQPYLFLFLFLFLFPFPFLSLSSSTPTTCSSFSYAALVPTFVLRTQVLIQSLAFPYVTFLALLVSLRSIRKRCQLRQNRVYSLWENLWERLGVKLNFRTGDIGQQRLFDRYLSFHREQAPAFIERYYCWTVPSLPHSVIRVIVHAVLIRTCENEYIFFSDGYFYFFLLQHLCVDGMILNKCLKINWLSCTNYIRDYSLKIIKLFELTTFYIYPYGEICLRLKNFNCQKKI